MQHGIFKIFKWQTQCTFQNCFVDWGDLEKGQQESNTIKSISISYRLSDQIVERRHSGCTQQTFNPA